MTTKKKAYHHGNLRAALLEAGFRRLETGKLEDLSLRALAKEVGVTPTAAYNHFADKMALMVEMKTEGYKNYDQYLDRMLQANPDASPDERLRIQARSYIHFGLENPSLFNLLFVWVPDESYYTPELISAISYSESVLQKLVVEMVEQDGHEITHYQRAVAAFNAWSLAHGMTMLLKSGVVDGLAFLGQWPGEFASFNRETQAEVFELIFTIQIDGFKAALHNNLLGKSADSTPPSASAS